MRKTQSPRETGNIYVWMFVIALGIGLLIAFFISFSAMPAQEIQVAKAQAAESQMKNHFQNFNLALEMYREDHQRYPATIDDLLKEQDMWGAYLNKSPIDPFTDEPYLWQVIDGIPSLISYGADGKPGGTGFNADKRSIDLKRKSPKQ